MSTVTFYTPTDMNDFTFWTGDVLQFTSTYVLTGDGYHAQEYFGNDFYYYNGYMYGTVTGSKEYFNGALEWSLTGANAPASLVYSYSSSRNATALQNLLLSGSDAIYGSYGSDVINSRNGNDYIYGNGGNDILVGDAGNDYYNGGTGVDGINYSSARNNFIITKDSSACSVTDSIGQNGTDTLVGVERISFSDGTYALDTGVGENAGEAYRIYQAAFGRTPDSAGLAYWIGQIDNGADLVDVASQFMTSTNEFSNMYGSNPTTSEFVDRLYQNVLGRSGEAAGVAYWEGQLYSGAENRAQVMVGFSESAENVSLVGQTIYDGFFIG